MTQLRSDLDGPLKMIETFVFEKKSAFLLKMGRKSTKFLTKTLTFLESSSRGRGRLERDRGQAPREAGVQLIQFYQIYPVYGFNVFLKNSECNG
jgi:hypothetical protein